MRARLNDTVCFATDEGVPTVFISSSLHASRRQELCASDCGPRRPKGCARQGGHACKLRRMKHAKFQGKARTAHQPSSSPCRWSVCMCERKNSETPAKTTFCVSLVSRALQTRYRVRASRRTEKGENLQDQGGRQSSPQTHGTAPAPAAKARVAAS